MLVLSQDGQTRRGSSLEQRPGGSDWDNLGESKAPHGTCESGNPKRGSRTHSVPFPALLSCPCGKSKTGNKKGCQPQISSSTPATPGSLLPVFSKVFCRGMTLGSVGASLADKGRAGGSHVPDFFATFSSLLSRFALGWSDPAKTGAAAAGRASSPPAWWVKAE